VEEAATIDLIRRDALIRSAEALCFEQCAQALEGRGIPGNTVEFLHDIE
jgi:hypothetical protein